MPETFQLTCVECGDTYTRRARNASRSRFCTKDCMHEYRRKHPDKFFNGNSSDDGELREQALERDGWECTLCDWELGESSRSLYAHHIVPSTLFADPEIADYLENLTAVCSMCHPDIEPEITDDLPRGLTEPVGEEFIVEHLPDVHQQLRESSDTHLFNNSMTDTDDDLDALEAHGELAEELREKVCSDEGNRD